MGRGGMKRANTGNQGARFHTESMRVGHTRYASRDPRDLAYKLRLAADVEKQSAVCHVCGRVALYRVYDFGGINRGACSEHKEAVRQSSRVFMAR